MATSSVNGNANGMRSGAKTLLLLSLPLNVRILEALGEGSTGQTDLLRACGSPPQSTMRSQLARFVDAEIVEKQRRNRFPSTLEYELTPAGRELLDVAGVLERWLANGPQGPLKPASSDAKAAIRALADAWSSTILRAIAAGPRSLTQLDELISSLNYPSLERRLTALRLIELITARDSAGRGTPYGATTWLREGIAPLVAALCWERRHDQAAPPPTRVDIEATFLLALPLIRLPGDSGGACRLAVELNNGDENRRFAGVLIEIAGGSITSCVTGVRGEADAWAVGPVGAWLNAVAGGDTASMELGGDGRLARTAVEGLHQALFAQAKIHAG